MKLSKLNAPINIEGMEKYVGQVAQIGFYCKGYDGTTANSNVVSVGQLKVAGVNDLGVLIRNASGETIEEDSAINMANNLERIDAHRVFVPYKILYEVIPQGQ